MKLSYQVVIVLICVVLFMLVLETKESDLVKPNKDDLIKSDKTRLDQILSQPDEEINLAEAALIVAKELYPDLDIDAYLERIDVMAYQVNDLMRKAGGNISDPEYQIRCINTLFFNAWRITYDYNDYFGRKASNCFLNGIMDTGKGACFTMPLLYLCVADRLNIPIHGVNVPNHFFLRYDDGKYRSNIEVTLNGSMGTDKTYMEINHITKEEIESGIYLQNLSKKEIVAIMLEQRGCYYQRIGEYEKALRDMKMVEKFYPTNATNFLNLSRMHKEYKKDNKTSDEYFDKAVALGFNFKRFETDYNLKYMEYCIQRLKDNGLDASKVEKERDKEIARLEEIKANKKTKVILIDHEKAYRELMESNKRNREKTFSPKQPNSMPKSPSPQPNLPKPGR